MAALLQTQHEIYRVVVAMREGLGVNISERKSGTEQMKKHKKLELVFLPPGGATGTVVHRQDTTRILPERR